MLKSGDLPLATKHSQASCLGEQGIDNPSTHSALGQILLCGYQGLHSELIMDPEALQVHTHKLHTQSLEQAKRGKRTVT